MPWDIVLTIILYLMQTVLAALGVYVSVNPPSNKKAVTFITVAFVVCALIGISAGIGLQVNNKHVNEKQQKQHENEMDGQKKLLGTINSELYQSQLSRERLQGNFDAVALLIGKSGDKMASAVLKLAESSSQITTMTNKQICSNTMDLVKRIHKFARDRREKSSRLSDQRMNAIRGARNKTEQEQTQIWQQYNVLQEQQWNNDQYEFRTTILGEMVYLKDELLKRLPSQPKPAPMYSQVFDYGSLAGVYPEEGAADYLEGLTRKLCP